MAAALFVVLERPRMWPLALAAFLVRGGIVVLVVPIVVLPTPTGLSNMFAGVIVDVVLGGTSLVLLVAGFAVATGIVAWIVVAGLAGARIDLELVAEALADDDATDPPAIPGSLAWSALSARIVAFGPLALALAFGFGRIVDASYGELLAPSELATPLVLRILLRVPDAIGLILLTWVGGEVVGGLAVRALAAGAGSVVRALGTAGAIVLRRPFAVLGTTVVTDLAVVAVLAPALVGAAIAWDRLGVVMALRTEPSLFVLVVFVGLWLGGLVLAAPALAWRQAAWTFEAYRRPVRAGATDRATG
jgi:hypothetical protein